jgi:hypothetical protein
VILTTKGMLDESILVKTEGSLDNANECTTWQEWRLGDELVRRDVQVQLKQVGAECSAANF